MSWRDDYKPYVPVAERRAQAAREVAKRIKRGETISPVRIEGRSIASTFWGQAWCKNLESYSDYANRLPRGRTYARNGSVVHLAIEPGRIKAMVSGSSLYEIQIEISALPKSAWLAIKQQSAGKLGSLIELLQGKLSQAVMALVTDRNHGLFPKPQEIKMRCSCPDAAGLCKHIAAVMYGVGSRLDTAPELLFKLRGVNQAELIEQAIPAAPTASASKKPRLANADLGAIFDIEIAAEPVVESAPRAPQKVAKAEPTAGSQSTHPARAKPVAKKAGRAQRAVVLKGKQEPEPATKQAAKSSKPPTVQPAMAGKKIPTTKVARTPVAKTAASTPKQPAGPKVAAKTAKVKAAPTNRRKSR